MKIEQIKDEINAVLSPEGTHTTLLTTIQIAVLLKHLPTLVALETALQELGFKSKKQGDLIYWHCYFKN